jgi:hypothetical protein
MIDALIYVWRTVAPRLHHREWGVHLQTISRQTQKSPFHALIAEALGNICIFLP